MALESTASIPMKGPALFEKQFAVTNSVRQLIRAVLWFAGGKRIFELFFL